MSGQLSNMNAPPPAFTAEDATWIAFERYGIRSMARVLAGERDLNFRLTDADRRDHVLKIWNHTQDPDVVRFQLAVLSHIAETDPGLPVARVMPGTDGEEFQVLKDYAGITHPAGLLSWLDGAFMRDAPLTDELKRQLGRALARLDLALAGFRHPAEERELIWDVCRVTQLRAFARDIPTGPERDLVKRSLDRFETESRAALTNLRRQVVHNDFNPDNILLDPQDLTTVTGIIDFGDVLYAPLICDLAIACAYQLSGSGDPLDELLPMVTGFNEAYPLEEEELAALPGLVRARLLCTLLISTRMATLFPENRAYLLGDNPLAAARLARMDALDPAGTRNRLREACGLTGGTDG